MDLTTVNRILKKGGYRGLARREFRDPNEEFHKVRMITPGFWKYMGHKIMRDEVSRKWYTIPSCDGSIFPDRDAARWYLHNQYKRLCAEIVRIQKERK